MARESDLAQTHQKFTAKERDTESGLDYFGARYFSGAQGRFTSADEPLADQHPDNPQSWNMYTYTRNNPLSSIDLYGKAVKTLTQLALQRIQSTVPICVRSQVIADKNGMLDRSAIDRIKSDDPNVKLLQQAVDVHKIIEVTTAPSLQEGQPKEWVGVPFVYTSIADQEAKVKAAGGDPSGIATPTIYDGYTQSGDQTPTGNVRVTIADGTGLTATEPASELAATTAHELNGHATPLVYGQPWKHEEKGVEEKIKTIVAHTRRLN